MKTPLKRINWLRVISLAGLALSILMGSPITVTGQSDPPPEVFLPLIVLDPSPTLTLTFTPTFTVTPTLTPAPTLTPTPTRTPAAIVYMPLITGRTVPLYATSYYIQDESPAEMYELGCRLGTRDNALPGKQDSLVILSFGQMWIENGVYGVGKFSPYWEFVPLSAVNTAVREYINGYWVCSGNDFQSQLTLGVGVNSFGRMNTGTTDQEILRNTANEFGKRFADLVNDVNLWAVREGIASQVYVAGANNIEWDSREDGNPRMWSAVG